MHLPLRSTISVSFRRRCALLAALTMVALSSCSSDPKTSPASAPVDSTAATTLDATTTAAAVDPTTATTVAAAPVSGFAQHVDVDLTLPDSTTIHFTGDVQLNSGTTNTETGIVGQSNLFVFPKVTGSFSNTSDVSVTLATARVEVFLDRALAHDCVINVADTPCDDAIIRGTLDTDAPTALQPGKTYDLPTNSKLSTILVPDADALSGASVAPVKSGAAVTGYAVVVAAPTVDKIATVIFDRSGKQVVSCPALPVDCMDADRSVLNG